MQDLIDAKEYGQAVQFVKAGQQDVTTAVQSVRCMQLGQLLLLKLQARISVSVLLPCDFPSSLSLVQHHCSA
jgi:hypothetical protein